eukprot:3172936-Prymnesium_polylepis.1
MCAAHFSTRTLSRVAGATRPRSVLSLWQCYNVTVLPRTRNKSAHKCTFPCASVRRHGAMHTNNTARSYLYCISASGRRLNTLEWLECLGC